MFLIVGSLAKKGHRLEIALDDAKLLEPVCHQPRLDQNAYTLNQQSFKTPKLCAEASGAKAVPRAMKAAPPTCFDECVFHMGDMEEQTGCESIQRCLRLLHVYCKG